MDIKGIVKGLHHITATVNDAQEDYDFFTRALGLRLVKETVNFDNEKVYHFYYANKNGSPSTVFTTFPYKGQGVRKGLIGAGQATHTAFSVPAASLDFWKERLRKFGVPFTAGALFGLAVLDFKDPSGLNIQIVGSDDDQREPVWKYDDITEAEAVRGMHHAILRPHIAPTSTGFSVGARPSRRRSGATHSMDTWRPPPSTSVHYQKARRRSHPSRSGRSPSGCAVMSPRRCNVGRGSTI